MMVDRLLLSAGAMKAGTTFLHNVLSRHPELYSTPEKEVHFFAHCNGVSRKLFEPLVGGIADKARAWVSTPRDILSNDFRRHRLSMVMANRYARIKDANRIREIAHWYAARYMTNPIDDDWFDRVYAAVGDRYACDFSNYTCLLDASGWQHVRSTTKTLRVIYTMRSPVERLWSHVKFHLIQAGIKEDRDQMSLGTLRQYLRNGNISCHSRYGDIVEHLQKCLDPAELKIIFFEEFVEGFPDGARDIEAFLGVGECDYRGVNPRKKANATEHIDIPPSWRDEIARAARPQLEKLSNLGIEVPDSYWE